MTVRIKFSKHGVLKYIGHLDLMRFFQKAFRRTDINVVYSKGFSPHMIMSFAQPLGVGLESDGEYFDVEIDDKENLSLIKDKLNEQMVDGVKILDVVLLPRDAKNAMASVKACGYNLVFDNDNPVNEALLDLFNQTEYVPAVKETKTQSIEFNLKDFVFDVKLIDAKTLYILVDASSSGNLKPKFFMEFLCRLAGQNSSNFPFHIFRTETFRESSGKLVPLGCFDEQRYL